MPIRVPSNTGSGNLTLFDQEWLDVGSDLVMTAKGDPPQVSAGVELFFQRTYCSRDNFGESSAPELHTRLKTALAYFYLTPGYELRVSSCSAGQIGMTLRLAEGGSAALYINKSAPCVQVLRGGSNPAMPPPPPPAVTVARPAGSPFSAVSLAEILKAGQSTGPAGYGAVSEPPDSLLIKRAASATTAAPSSGPARVFRREWQ